MERGYVKLWRKSLDSSIFANPKIWFFWTYCLMKATHKKYKTTEGFQQIELEPGQFIFGRKKASEETGLSEQNIRTCLSFLKKSQNLTIKPTNKFSIVSITNWDTYQPKEVETNQQSNQQVTNNQPTSNQQVTTNKNNKHIENKENKDIPPLPPKPKKQKKVFIPPTKEEVINFFIENEYDGNKGADAFEFYACANWFDSRGNKVKNWKQKMRGVWFKDDNKVIKNNFNGSGQQGTVSTGDQWLQMRKDRENAKK